MLKIGVYGERHRAHEKVRQIYNELDESIVYDVVFGKDYSRIYLKDGSNIQTVFTKSTSRGYRFDFIYVDKKYKDTEYFDNVILPSLSSSKLIDDNRDFRYVIRWF